MKSNKWYVITGGPSVGKSTLLAELDKLGHQTLPEAARVIIDDALAAGRTLSDVRGNERRFQLDVLEHKIKTEAAHPKDLLTFFDRGMHDTLAYLRLHGFDIDQTVNSAMEKARYNCVFLLKPLEQFHQDYARTESVEEALRLNELLRQAYQEHGMEPIDVPVLPPAERAQFVLQHLT